MKFGSYSEDQHVVSFSQTCRCPCCLLENIKLATLGAKINTDDPMIPYGLDLDQYNSRSCESAKLQADIFERFPKSP